MAKFKEYQKKLQRQSRFEMLKTALQSVAITVSAVVAVVVFVPKSPIATLDNVQAFTNEVAFHVEVTDEDNAIYPGSLKAILENQTERYEQSLDLGSTSGSFIELNANTQYDLKIVAEKGFGLETLVQETVITETRVGGAITSNTLLSSPEADLLDYDIGLLVSDPETEFKEIYLRYGTRYASETEITNYQTVTLTPGQTSFMLTGISNFNLLVSVILEGVYFDDTVIVLDDFEFNTPFKLYAFLEPMQISDETIVLSMYLDSTSGLDANYQIIVKQDKMTVKSVQVDTDVGEGMHHGVEVEISGLKPNTVYTLELVASYINPIWLTREVALISSAEIETLSNFSSSVNVIETELYYEITITLEDPEHNFQLGYYEVYQIEPDYEWYYSGGQNGFTPS
ncbi:MAG: hypothetical protein JXR38_03370, partial [Bacilli bacterium]|nr:hypothetical protein [Bacilli bacterium]